ncbi:MAG: acyltransferase [Planctomycetota bacterium]
MIPHAVRKSTTDLWLDLFRGWAITGVFFEHWLERVSGATANSLWSYLNDFAYRSGCLVQLFFVVSGFGLTRSLLSSTASPEWMSWFQRRIRKTVLPFWLACMGITLALNGVGWLHPSLGLQPVSIEAMLLNMLFLRNQFPSSWVLNGAFWFMPVIIGLYVLYPILFQALKRWGAACFLALTFVVQSASILMAIQLGWDGSHDSSVAIFHLAPFAFGMCVAKWMKQGRLNDDTIRSPTVMLLGIVSIILASVLARLSILGSAANDIFTSFGLFVLGQGLVPLFARRESFATRLSLFAGRHSYTMFLIHLPILLMIQGTSTTSFDRVHAGLFLLSGAVCFVAILLISAAIDSAFAWLVRELKNRIARLPSQWLQH